MSIDSLTKHRALFAFSFNINDLCCLRVQLSTKFVDVGNAPNMSSDSPFRCQMCFEGPSVIEGIRQLAEAGVTDAELPKYVANVKTLRHNKILVRPKAASTVHR